MARIKYGPCPRCRERGADSRGDNLVEYADGGAHCFACGFHRAAPHWWTNHLNPDSKEEVNGSKGLPPDFTREVPGTALKWLLQYGLPYSYWRPYIGWSEKYGRLVITTPNFSLGRLIDTAKPGQKWYVWGDCHKDLIEFGRDKSAVPLSPTVLVEDIISAHKVGAVVHSICLFGTHVHPPVFYGLQDRSERPVVLWLDKDQEGATAKKALRIQMLTNRPVRVLHTNNDPKSLSFNEIKEVLNVE